MQWNELNINKKYVIITTTISIFVYHSEQKKAFIRTKNRNCKKTRKVSNFLAYHNGRISDPSSPYRVGIFYINL